MSIPLGRPALKSLPLQCAVGVLSAWSKADSFVPDGTAQSGHEVAPPLKGWAVFGRPCGTSGGENSPLALEALRVGEGASGTLSALGHSLLQISLEGQASGGQGGFSPLHPLTRVPLDPVRG